MLAALSGAPHRRGVRPACPLDGIYRGSVCVRFDQRNPCRPRLGIELRLHAFASARKPCARPVLQDRVFSRSPPRHGRCFLELSMRRAFLIPLVLSACQPVAASHGPVSAATVVAESPPHPAAPDACVLVCGNAAATHLEIPTLDHHVDEAENADGVFASMHGDLLACYRARVAELRDAHAYLMVDLVVAADGSVRKVETTGGALFGDRTMQCITRRIQRASFAPVRGGGTLHIQIPLNFTQQGPTESTI